MTYPDEAAWLFRNLKELGINIAMDDLGTGYSSLACLKRLPLSCLKIDCSFFRDIPDDMNDTSIVRTIIEIAHCLNLRAVAEGIETKDQLAFLRQRKCDEFQGYLLAKPLHSFELESLLDRQPRSSECITVADNRRN